MSFVLDEVSEHIHRIAGGSFEESTAARARICVLHAITCAVSGSELPWSRIATGLASAQPGGSATLWAHPVATSTEGAVLANAVHAQSTMAEDMHAPSLTHPGSVVVPVALGLGEELGADGAKVLAAVIAGYDVMCLVGEALKTPEFVEHGFRPSGVFGPLGAAAAAAVLLGLSHDETVSALGIAANTSAGLREWAVRGSTEIFFHNGFAARNGLQAARLAQAGLTGPASAVEGSAGMNRAFSGGTALIASIAQNLATRAAVQEVYFKRYPACGAVQTVMSLATRMRKSSGFTANDVESVLVRTHLHGKENPGCDYAGPWDSVPQAQMSNQMGVVLALREDLPGVSSYSSYADPATLDLASRVTVVEEPRCTAVYPQESRAELVIALRDGRTLESTLTGVFPLSDDEVPATTIRSLAVTYGERAASDAVAALLQLDGGTDVRGLMADLRQSTVPGEVPAF